MNIPVSNPPLASAVMDFVPSLLNIQETPPARLPHAVLYSVSALFVCLLVWSMVGELDIVASADGKLVPQSYVKIVQPAEGGIVSEILVHEGQSVQPGQVLMRMDANLARADETSLREELALSSLQLRRIDAELSAAPLVRAPSDPGDLFRKIDAQYHEHRSSYELALGQQNEALKIAQQEFVAAKAMLAKLQEVTPLLKQQADAYTDLGKQGYAGQILVRDKQREYIEKNQDLSAQRAAVERMQAAVDQARQQLSQVSARYRSELYNERVDIDARMKKQQQEWTKQAHRSSLLELKATQAGVVKDVATHSIGSVVSPGTVLLTIVPEKEPLVAEVTVKNDDVGFVNQQQRVKLKLVAYPFERYGMLDGQVRHLGPDASAASDRPDTPANDQASLGYKALVALDQQELHAEGRTLKLVPGMRVIAEIHQGRRTVMQYLLSPITRSFLEGGRER